MSDNKISRLADHFTFGMSMKRLKGKFRLSSTTSLPATVTLDEWSKYDERLIDAAYKSDREKIKETIRKKGASPTKVSRDGQTALHISVKKGMGDCVDFMLAENPDLSTIDLQGRTVYHIAASKGDSAMLKKLLDYSRWSLDIKDTKEMTALHYSVASGEDECVKLLLENNTPVDSRDSEGRTPLLVAVINGYEKIAMTLILHGVDVNASDYKERTPIIMACIQGMREVVALLISKGADSKIVDADGKSLEVIASEAGHTDIVDILRNSADSGIMDIEHMRDENDGLEEGLDVNNDDEDDEDVDDEEGENDIDEDGDEMEEKEPEKRTERSRMNRRSILKSADETSLTTSIIESLMGCNDTISESGSESREKFEKEREEMQYEIAQRDQRIEELEIELSALKKKSRWETEMRFQAEKEVLDLKNQLENAFENHATYSIEEQDEEETSEVDEEETQTAEEDEVPEINETEKTSHKEVAFEDEVSDEDEDDDEEKETEEVKEVEDDDDDKQQKGYESDDSVSWQTGYRKKSLGTAKQHIDMLEEHILSLEEDIVHKDNEISELESKLQSSRELVDLNNNTTVSLEVFNQYKAEKKTERNTYKDQIKILEDQLHKVEVNLRTAESKNVILSGQVQTESEDKNNTINNLKDEATKLQKQISEHEGQYAKDISCYREQLLAVYQNKMDDRLTEVLKKIVKLRS